jgi:site-specific DNA-cytosine methylase
LTAKKAMEQIDMFNEIIIDAFAGRGGASKGIEKATDRPVNIAINHDPYAILIHKTNHPNTLHIPEDIFSVDLRKYIKKGQRVKLFWASPDCTSHSKDKGGKPKEKGLRILPWAVYKLCKQIRDITGYLPETVFMENVEEIQDWGPLDIEGYPIKERKGEDYNRFIRMMKALGYVFDSRELIAADYGAPTTRKRWYGIFRSDGKPIRWPEPTHGEPNRIEVNCGLLEPWRPISECIDWTDLGSSIFTRKIPLKEKTLNRIARGMEKFIINDPEPYILPDDKAASFLIQYHSETKSDYVRGQSVNEPIKTIDTSNRYGLVTAFITKFYRTTTGQSVNTPIHTITTSPGHFGIVSAFMIKYYGNMTSHDVQEPIDTITTKDRFGLVTVIIDGEPYRIVDIYLRMLKPRESFNAQSFPEDYIIEYDHEGNLYPAKEQTARCGNAVPPVWPEALTRANLPELCDSEDTGRYYHAM